MTRLEKWLMDGAPRVRLAAAICFIVLASLLNGIIGIQGCLGAAPMGITAVANKVSGAAQAANAALPLLVERYRRAGVDIILDVKTSGGTKEQARAELAVLDAEWKFVWAAWERLQLAHEAASSSLERGDNDQGSVAAVEEFEGAFCELLAVWPKDVPAKPIAPIRCLVVR